ncbi:MAG: lysophospholipid acyltransferase family protein [Bacteroidales bacterium]|nr:lysophospholipid acyltransferase family protein [Bacteroidales bacterium]
MKLLSAVFFRIFVLFVGILPYRILYAVSDFLKFILQHVVGYRKNVVEDNLRKTFPDKSPEELKRIEDLSYKNLSDMLIEGIRAFTITKKQAARRFYIKNPEIFEPFRKQEKGVILVLGHYANWEWAVLSGPLYLRFKNLITFYKPLKNTYIDSYIQKNRTRTGMKLLSIAVTGATFKKHEKDPAIYILVADQSPSNPKKSFWVPFLKRDTAFLHGPENYAKDYDLPVVFADIQRVKRGFYEAELSILAANPSELPDGEITRLYANKLEKIIYKKPEDWLWSHKRWKHSR